MQKNPCEKKLEIVGTFKDLERTNHWRYKGETGRNESRRWIGALATRITNLDFIYLAMESLQMVLKRMVPVSSSLPLPLVSKY